MAISFTDEAWDGPGVSSRLSADDYCSVCLVDTNEPGQPKIKGNCKLPVRSNPGAPYNRNALRNAASRVSQMSGVPDADVRKAASRLVGLERQAGIETGEGLLKLAGRQ